jgi:HK97 family phage portal protein
MGLRDLARSIVARLSRDSRAPLDSRVWYNGRTTAGVLVTQDTAITVATVWACLRYLSQTVAVLPWHVMRDTDAGGEVAKKHPVDWLLWKRPNPEWSAFQFRETLLHWALRRGNGYAEIERDTVGRPLAMWPIHPDRVTPRRDQVDNRLLYRVTSESGGFVDLEAADVFHLRGFGEDVIGLNVMAYAAESIGAAKAAQLFGAAFFGNNAQPAGFITMKRALSPDGMKKLEAKLKDFAGGPRKANKNVILDNEMDYKPATIEPNKAQFLETQQFYVDEVCRWFGVPPHKVQHLLRATFSNIEHQAIEVVVDSVSPWVKRFEEEADFKLFGIQNRQNFYSKMNLNALLRGDSAARSTFYRELRNVGALSVNEIRRLEEMPTLGEDGDKYVMQSAMTTLEKIGEDPPTPAAPAIAPPANDDDQVDEPTPEDLAAQDRIMQRLAHLGEPANVDAD